jgi:hypothetical protein
MKKILALIGLAIALPVLAQVTPTTPLWTFTNVLSVYGDPANYSNIVSARPIDIPQGKTVSIMAHLGSTNSLFTTNTIGIAWALRVDGTNYCNATNQWLWHLVSPTGTGPIFSVTNFEARLTQGADKMKIVQITNNTLTAANRFFVTNVWVGIPNN